MQHLIRNIVIISIISFVIYLAAQYILPYVLPFVIAGLLTVSIEPLVSLIHRKTKVPRSFAVVSTLSLVIGSATALVILFVTRLIAELIQFSAALPHYTEIVARKIVALRDDAERFYFSLPLTVLDFIANNVGTIEENIGAYLAQVQAFTKDLLNYFITLISSIPGILVIILVSLIATFFMSKDRSLVRNFWLQLIPQPWGRKIMQVIGDIVTALGGYVKAQLILISITFLEVMVGLMVIDAPYALLMAVVIGIFDLIPILGPSTVFIPWMVWEFINNNSAFALKLTVLYIIVLAVRQLLEAKIVANALGLHPLATLISIYVGLQLFGVAGLILGPVSLIGLKALERAGIIDWRTGRF